MSCARNLQTLITLLSAITCAGCSRHAGRVFYEAGQCPVIERTGPELATGAVSTTSGVPAEVEITHRAPTTQPGAPLLNRTAPIRARSASEGPNGGRGDAETRSGGDPIQARASEGSNRARSASEGPTTQPAAAPATQPVAYTSPRGDIRQLAFLALLGAATPGPEGTAAARQASEASLASVRSLTAGGAGSLAAPQPRTLAAVVGQSGLQRGMAAGLGFARTPNLLTPQANPLTGPNGRCQELIRAGFFPNQAACSKFFGK